MKLEFQTIHWSLEDMSKYEYLIEWQSSCLLFQKKKSSGDLLVQKMGNFFAFVFLILHRSYYNIFILTRFMHFLLSDYKLV